MLGSMSPSPTLRLAALLAALGTAGLALAHVGGIPTRPLYRSPLGIVRPDGGTVDITWSDDDNDPTGILDFAYQAHNAPPGVEPPDPTIGGTLIGSAPVSDITDVVTWDLTQAPVGAWYVYARTVDPPFCLATFADGVVVVDDGSLPLAVLVTRPSGAGDVFRDEAIIEVEALAATAPTLTVRAGPATSTPRGDGGCGLPANPENPAPLPLELATGVVMVADPASGADRWRAEVTWDVSGMENGDYVVQVEATDGTDTRTVFGSGLLAVYHPVLRPDGGSGAGGSTGGSTGGSDGGTGDPDRNGGCACSATGDNAAGVMAGILLLALPGLRRRHRPTPERRLELPSDGEGQGVREA